MAPKAGEAGASTGAATPVASELAATAEYKVVELSAVDEGSLERALNEWTRRGWRFDGLQFAMRESSRRPSMAFLLFTRARPPAGAGVLAPAPGAAATAAQQTAGAAAPGEPLALGEPLGGASGGIFAVERAEPVWLEPLGPADAGAPFAFRSPSEALRHLERLADAADTEGKAAAGFRAPGAGKGRRRGDGASERGSGSGGGEGSR